MKMKLMYLLMATIAPALIASGSEEGGVPFEFQAVTIKTLYAGYEISLETDKTSELSKIIVKWKGETATLVKKDFLPLKDVILSRIDLMATSTASFGSLNSLVISIPFDRKFNHNGSKPECTVNIAKLYFFGTKLNMWKLSKAIKGKPGKWETSIFAVETGKYYDRAVEEDQNNPFATFDFSKGDL